MTTEGNQWHTEEPTSQDANYSVKVIMPKSKAEFQTERDQEFHARADDGAQKAADAFLKMMSNDGVEEYALETAAAFYKKFKSACHGISRRNELDQLYNATYPSFGCNVGERAPFNRVLFAMARNMRVVRVIGGGTLEWTAFDRQDTDDRRDHSRNQRDDRRNQRDYSRDQRDDRPRFDDRRDQRDDRPRFDDRRNQRDYIRDQRDDRPRFDDRRDQRDYSRDQRHSSFQQGR